jgi:hypothetical protein
LNIFFTNGVSPHAPKYFFFEKKVFKKNFCFPKDSLRKDNPELNFNPGAAEKWIKPFVYLRLSSIIILWSSSLIHFSKAQEYRIEIQLAESAGKQPLPRNYLRRNSEDSLTISTKIGFGRERPIVWFYAKKIGHFSFFSI